MLFIWELLRIYILLSRTVGEDGNGFGVIAITIVLIVFLVQAGTTIALLFASCFLIRRRIGRKLSERFGLFLLLLLFLLQKSLLRFLSFDL